jgi:hypothetical protein
MSPDDAERGGLLATLGGTVRRTQRLGEEKEVTRGWIARRPPMGRVAYPSNRRYLPRTGRLQ